MAIANSAIDGGGDEFQPLKAHHLSCPLHRILPPLLRLIAFSLNSSFFLFLIHRIQPNIVTILRRVSVSLSQLKEFQFEALRRASI